MNNHQNNAVVILAILGAALVAGINVLGILRPEAANGFSDPIVFLLIIVVMGSAGIIAYRQLNDTSIKRTNPPASTNRDISYNPPSSSTRYQDWFFQKTKLRLEKRHPSGWLVLGYWLFILPAQFNIYRARFGRETLWPAGIWLASCIISLPFLASAFGLLMRTHFTEGLLGIGLFGGLWYFVGSSGYHSDQMDSTWWRTNPNLRYIVFITLLLIALFASALLTLVGGLTGLFNYRNAIGDIASSFMIGVGCSICFYVTPLESLVQFTAPSGIRISEIYLYGKSVLVGIWSGISALIVAGILAGGLVGFMALIIAFVSSAILEDNLERGKASLLSWGAVAGLLVSLVLLILTYVL